MSYPPRSVGVWKQSAWVGRAGGLRLWMLASLSMSMTWSMPMVRPGGFRRARMLLPLSLRLLIWRRCSPRNGLPGSMISAWRRWMMSPGMGEGLGSW